MNEIEEEEVTIYIQDKCRLDSLKEEYQDNILPGFLLGISYLHKKYSFMKHIHRDGNCFYRSFLYCYLENIRIINETNTNESIKELQKFKIKIENSKNQLILIGYDEYTFECFYDEIIELLDNLLNLSYQELLAIFQSPTKSNTYTWYMRLLTTLSLKLDPDRYMPFLIASTNCLDIDSFCKQEVLPMGRECEQIQITALVEYLELCVKIEYLDGQAFDESKGLSLITCGTDTNSSSPFDIHLLYRPGHYDILIL